MAAVATETEQPASAEVVCAYRPRLVGNAIVQQYYHIQHQSPELVHRFYQDMSKLGRPDGNGTMIITTTMQAINEKILSLNCGEYRTEIKSVDAQESYNGGFLVLVTGYLAAKDNMIQKFTQTFFLAPQEKGYFVLNDMFRYMEDIKHHNGNQSSANDVEAPLTPEKGNILLLCGRDVFEQTMVSIEFNGEEALSPSDDGEVSIVEEEVLVADIVDEVPDDLQMVVESNSKIDEMPNKSYASIVMDMKESAVPLSSPAPPAPRRSVTKSQGQQVNLAQASASAAEPPLSGSNAIENGNNQEGEADGYSIYIKGLPLNATLALLEKEFKRFGPTKTVFKLRVTNSRDFVLALWNLRWQVLCKQQLRLHLLQLMDAKWLWRKRVNKVWFSAERGYGFRNNYGSSRGYSHGDFNGRTEFGNRGGNNRGGFSNRGADGGYQRDDNMGRDKPWGGIAVNGTTKTVAPQLSATA
ncbi:hypothetical protein ACSBR1_002005 [Camellia fascicularis]